MLKTVFPTLLFTLDHRTPTSQPPPPPLPPPVLIQTAATAEITQNLNYTRTLNLKTSHRSIPIHTRPQVTHQYQYSLRSLDFLLAHTYTTIFPARLLRVQRRRKRICFPRPRDNRNTYPESAAGFIRRNKDL